MNKENINHIQGMLFLGYGKLPCANYLFLQIENESAFKSWLKPDNFQFGKSSPYEACMNIAFTYRGLRKLGLTVTERDGFSRQFIEGMDTDHRARILGDIGQNKSSGWTWGNKDHHDMHCVLILFAKDKSKLDDYYKEQVTNFPKHGIKEVASKIESISLGREGRKEHFGFRDGISQPVMRGLGWKSSEHNLVNPGEFILGYENNYGKLPNSPFIKNSEFDFGLNGSYMVYRQLEQNVPLFWKTICGYFGGPQNGKNEAIALAAKMVGRWPSGNPLTWEASEKIKKEDLFNFGFYKNDKLGTKCPLGSHIRRSNPRDSLSDSEKTKDLDSAIKVVNNHRILRRGRPYGPPIVKNLEIEEILKVLDNEQTVSRGLNFICFNTDIARQFEFVQHTWANNKKFHNLYNDVDPIIGVQRKRNNEMENTGDMENTQFEVQCKPVRKRYKHIPPFIKVRGGSYFFMPGIDAIDFLAKIPKSGKH